MQTTLLIALLALCLAAPADDLFFADGRVVTARSMTWQGRTLEGVQLGARSSASVYVHHKAGEALVPVASLPAVWRSAMLKREAAALAPPGAPPAVVSALAAALATAGSVSATPIPYAGTAADGRAVVAAQPAALLVVTATGAGWLKDATLPGAAAARAAYDAALVRQAKDSAYASQQRVASAKDPFAAGGR